MTMPLLRRRPGFRFVARATIAIFVFTSSAPLAYAAQSPADQIQTSTISSIAETQTTTFTDASMKNHDATDFENHWIRIVTSSNPAGFLTKIVAFDSATGTFTLQ